MACKITVEEGYRMLYYVTCRVCLKHFPSIMAWEKHIDIKIKKKPTKRLKSEGKN